MDPAMEWLNYHHLFYFWTVIREGSLTAASARLNLAPSTVSAQLSRLEEVLGGKLLQRSGRNLEPTELGRLVFRYADEIFALGREMLDTIHGRPVAGPLSLKVGVVDALPKFIVRRLLEPALQLPERVKLVCLENKEDALLAGLAMHSLDVVLSDAPLRPGLNVKAYSHLLGECGITFFAVKKLAGSLRENFPQSLHEAPILLPMDMTALRGGLERWFAALGVRPAIAGEFDDSALLNVFGQEGDGVFVAPTVIESEVLRQHLVEIVGRTQAVKERYYAISAERMVKHPAVVAMLEAARHNLFTVVASPITAPGSVD